MRDWYKKSFRRSLVDVHIEEWDDSFLSQYDENAYFIAMKEGNIKSPMIYINSHVGYCYWPTESGKMHNGFNDREDTVRNLFNLCTQAGMDPHAYYSLIYNNWAYDNYPGWRMRNVHGRSARDGGHRYGLCCPNNLDYRKFTEVQIKEFSEYFDFDGIWLDMTFWPMVCYCDSCKNRWKSEVGGDIPIIVDWSDPRWLEFQKKREEWLTEFAMFATSELKKNKPHCSVAHQYSPACEYWQYGVTENISKASEYASGDFYGGLAEQSFACKLYYGLTQNQPFEYMTSRCYPNLQEHTTNKTMDQLEVSVYLTYAHHGACLLIDASDPKGTINHKVYEQVGKVFRESEKYEEYFTKGELVQDVGIYFSLNSKMDVEQKNIYIGTLDADNRKQPHLEAAMGAVTSLRSCHVPVGVLNSWKLDDIEKVKVLVLSDIPFMTSEEIETIKEYTKKGGKVYLSGRTSAELVKEMFGLKNESQTEENVTYIAPTDAGKKYMKEYSDDYPMTFFAKQVIMSGNPKGTVLATITLPYTVPLDSMSFGSGTEYSDISVVKIIEPTMYKFSSIHSNPPGISTEYPAIVKAQYGNGTAIWTSVPIEAHERFLHRELFSSLIMELLGEASFRSDNAPDCVEFVMFEDTEAKYLSIVNLQDVFKVIDIYNFDICIKADEKPKSVKLLPAGDEILFAYADGYINTRIDRLHTFKMLAIVK